MFWRLLVSQWLRHSAGDVAREAVKQASDNAKAPKESNTNAAGFECDVVFVSALSIEVGGLVDRLTHHGTIRGDRFTLDFGELNGRPVAIAISGPGCEAAQRVTEAVIDAHHPKWIVSTGFAGGLVEQLSLGDIFLPNRVITTTGGALSIDIRSGENSPGVNQGTILTVDEIVSNPRHKRRFAEEYGAQAVDMESFAVAQVCQQRGVRMIGVRVISDTVHDSLPAEVENLMKQTTSISRAGAVASALFRRPGCVKDLYRLKENALVSSDKLARFLEQSVVLLS